VSRLAAVLLALLRVAGIGMTAIALSGLIAGGTELLTGASFVIGAPAPYLNADPGGCAALLDEVVGATDPHLPR
jgi:hypothetical protein